MTASVPGVTFTFARRGADVAGAVGLTLVAGGIAAANEAIFAPVALAKNPTEALNPATLFNWRLIPATVLLAFLYGGLEAAAPGFGKGLAGLTVLAVLIVPTGNAGTPLENAATLITTSGKAVAK